MGLRGSFWMGSGSDYCNCNYILKWYTENVAFPNAPNRWWSQRAESIALVSLVIISLMLDIRRRSNLRLLCIPMVILLTVIFSGIWQTLLLVFWLLWSSLIKDSNSTKFGMPGLSIRLLVFLSSIIPWLWIWLLTHPWTGSPVLRLWIRLRLLSLMPQIWLDSWIISSMILLVPFRDSIVLANGGKESFLNGSLLT